jgi:tape measure domain-containing protein
MSNNVLEFFIKMKDLMSSGLTKLAQNSKKAFTSVQGDVDKAIAKNKQLADSFEEVDRKAASSGGGIMSWGRKLGIGLSVAGLAAGAGGFMKSSAQSYMNYEKQSKSFEVLAGNKGIGQTLAGELNKFQQDTILGPEVFKNAQTMMSFGITADKIMPSLRMLGEVSMGDAEKMQALTLAFSQTQSAGKLMGQDLLQYVNAGFNPLHEISVMTGKSMGDLRKEMEKGGITSGMVAKAFEHATGKGGLFNGMLDQMAQTGSGQVAQLEGQFESLKIAVGERMKPATNALISGLSSAVGWMKELVEIPIEKKLQDQINEIRGLQAELTSSNTSHARQVELLHQLEQINPNIVKGINEQNISYSKLAANINEVTGALQKKIFLEHFNKDNADTLTSYSNAQDKYNENYAKSLSYVAQAAPDIAQRSDLTIGQKQMLAQKRLKGIIGSGKDTKYHITTAGNGMGVGSQTLEGSREGDLLYGLQTTIKNVNDAAATAQKLSPKVGEINKSKNALMQQIDSVLGVKSMTATAAGLKGSGSGASTGTTDTGKNVAGGITGGGPKVINIHGVKFTDKVEVHAATMTESIDQLERIFEEMYLRILNSGASVQ